MWNTFVAALTFYDAINCLKMWHVVIYDMVKQINHAINEMSASTLMHSKIQ